MKSSVLGRSTLRVKTNPTPVLCAGMCVGMNGKTMTPLEVIVEANKIGGRNGVGKHRTIVAVFCRRTGVV